VNVVEKLYSGFFNRSSTQFQRVLQSSL